MNEDGSNLTDLFTSSSAAQLHYRPSFSSNGQSMVYAYRIRTAGAADRWRVDAADISLSSGKPVATNVRTIAQGTTTEQGFLGGKWSPTRSEVAVVKATSTAASIWLADPAGSNDPVLIYTVPDGHNVSSNQLAWSPTGDSLLLVETWTAVDGQGLSWSASQLRLISRPSTPGTTMSTSLATYFTNAQGQTIGHIDWSHRDGRVTVTTGGALKLFDVSSSSPTLTTLVSGGSNGFWSPATSERAADTKIRYRSSTGAIYEYTVNDGTVTQVLSAMNLWDWERR